MIVFKDRADEVFHEGMERGIHKLVESGSRRRLIKAFTRGAMVGYYFASDLCESPVERIFLAAAVWSLHRKDSLLLVLPPSCVRPHVDAVIVPQYTIGRYRADFAIYAGPVRLVVEVDGHDFHERTKEQASRGKRRARDLQLSGWSVFPFTGSDVWNDPFGCCDDINRFINVEVASFDRPAVLPSNQTTALESRPF
jgi:hypothetical protein